MAVSDKVVFKTQGGGRVWTITVRPLTDQLNRSVLQKLKRKGFILADGAGAEEKVALADITVRELAKTIEVTDGDEVREATPSERDALLAFNKVALEVLSRGKALNELVENELELVEGNSGPPSASS